MNGMPVSVIIVVAAMGVLFAVVVGAVLIVDYRYMKREKRRLAEGRRLAVQTKETLQQMIADNKRQRRQGYSRSRNVSEDTGTTSLYGAGALGLYDSSSSYSSSDCSSSFSSSGDSGFSGCDSSSGF